MNHLKTTVFAIACSALLPLLGCHSAASHRAALHSSQERDMTVGVVQKEIRRGMSQAEVSEALGSPNIVTREDSGADTWVYDKIATEASSSQDNGNIWLILLGYNKSAGASATTQKTLTVVVRFDTAGRVANVKYHSTKF